MRHVLFGDDPGHDTLVAVPSGHLVTDGELTFSEYINFDQFRNARRQFVTARDPLDLFLVLDLNSFDGLGGRVHYDLDLAIDLRILDDRQPPLEVVDVEFNRRTCR